MNLAFWRKQTRRALGLRRGVQAPRVSARLLGEGPSLVGHADLTQYASPVSDQYTVSRCVAHGISGAIYTTLAAKGEPLGFVPDVDWLYAMCLRSDRAQDYPFTPVRDLPALRDVGTRLDTAVAVIARYGLAPTVRPSTRIFTYHQAVIADALRARTSIVIGAYSVGSLSQIATALERGHSLAIGGFWGSTLFDREPTATPIGAQDLSDPYGGGHCVELLGYRTTGTAREWLIKNSWGSSWGSGGLAWATTDFLRQQWSAWVLDVEVAS